MNETKNMSESWTNVTEAWEQVSEAARRASGLYVKEMSAYLNWAQGIQREVLERSVVATREMSQFGERQLAFLARMRENLPLWGNFPKATVMGKNASRTEEPEAAPAQ